MIIKTEHIIIHIENIDLIGNKNPKKSRPEKKRENCCSELNGQMMMMMMQKFSDCLKFFS